MIAIFSLWNICIIYWYLAMITIIQVWNIKLENGCQVIDNCYAMIAIFSLWNVCIICWYLAMITIIHVWNIKLENGCQVLTSFSERYIMIGNHDGSIDKVWLINMSLEFKGFEFKNDLSQVWHIDRGS